MKKILFFTFVFTTFLFGSELDGKKVFETYCWGCHHQSAVAFGPPFTQIASKRTREEIMAYIIDPMAMYQSFGYKRTVMTQFHLSDEEIDLIAEYILSFKGQ